MKTRILIILTWLMLLPLQAQIKISELPVVTTLGNTDKFIVLQGGVTNAVAYSSMLSEFIADASGTASININGTVGATTPAAGAFTTLTNTGAAINSAAGAVSTPALLISGVPSSAGTATTDFPLVYINDPAATASTTLNTAGTYFGVNGNDTQDLMNLFKDGVSQFKLSSTGVATFAGAVVGLSTISSSANLQSGQNVWLNTNGGILYFGSSNDASISRNAAGVLQFGTTAANALGSILASTETLGGSGAASTPALTLSGVPFAGTGTTSFPLVYINDASATASTTLNTAGTYFGVNGDGAQDLMNLLKDGVSAFKVASTGATSIGAAGGLIVYSTGGNANDFISIGATANRNIVSSSNALGHSYSLLGDSTGSGGPAELRGGSGFSLKWRSTTRADAGSDDTGIARNAAGVIEVNTGTAISGTSNTGKLKAGAVTLLDSGAASAPSLNVTGVPFAGTGTTSFPLVYINDANATAAAGLSTTGTYFGINGDGTQDLMNVMKDGSAVFRIASTGGVTAPGPITMIHNSGINWSAGGGFYSTSNGFFQLFTSGFSQHVGLRIATTNLLEVRNSGNTEAATISALTFLPAGTATTCTGATIGTGSKSNAGFVTATTTGTSTVVVTFPVTAPTGWTIMATDITSGVTLPQTAKSTTTATFAGVTTTGDVIQYMAMAY